MPLLGDKKLSKSELVRWEALVELTWNDPAAIFGTAGTIACMLFVRLPDQ